MVCEFCDNTVEELHPVYGDCGVKKYCFELMCSVCKSEHLGRHKEQDDRLEKKNLSHTSGSWEVAQELELFGCNDTMQNGWPAITIYGKGSPVAFVAGNGKSESRPNAYLIAAAPELLRALQAIEFMCSTNDTQLGYSIGVIARDAIAKATETITSK
jgi:hypothetical protein